jgi:general secretion pathway protein F/type IV pilus assembly protein PilC
MPDFSYVARDSHGKKITGAISAGSAKEVASQLAAKHLFPVSISSGKTSVTISTGKVAGSKMVSFYSQLASLLRSGVPLLRGLTVLSQQSGSKVLQSVLQDVRARVEDGESLGDAFARFPKVFNVIAVSMVRAGSEGGFLEDALERIASFIEQQEELKGKTIGALAYPAFISAVGFIIVVVLLVFFVPNFESIFETMRRAGTLPSATTLLLAMSSFMQRYWWLMMIVAFVAFVGARTYFRTDVGARRLDVLKIKTPLLGPVLLNLAVARFCRVLGTLLNNGVTLLRALEISRHAAANRVLTDAVGIAIDDVTSGEKLYKPLEKSGHFPPTVTEMISVAEESNSLDTVLTQIADSLEKSTYRRLEIVVRLLEPMLLLVLAMVVMFIVLALMYPILTSSSAIG